jgi:hypothetical protein
LGTSTGGQACFITNLGGTVDISGLSSGGMTAGSIEVAGTYHLGSKALTVGLNNLSTEVSRTIADGGVSGGTGGALIKVGHGNADADRHQQLQRRHKRSIGNTPSRLIDSVECQFSVQRKSEKRISRNQRICLPKAENRISGRPTNGSRESRQTRLAKSDNRISTLIRDYSQRLQQSKRRRAAHLLRPVAAATMDHTLSSSFLLWLVKMRKLGTLWTKSARSLGHSVR